MKRLTSTLAILITLVFLTWALPSFSGDNQLSRYEYDIDAEIGYLDLVVSLDWNPDQDDRDGDYQTAFERFAQTVFDMSEGQTKLRKIRVFVDNAESGSCDIFIQDKSDRANADANGFGHSGGRINMFTKTSSGSNRSAKDMGLVLAHELGHYFYGLYDEYKEADSKYDSYIYMPHSDDKPCKNCLVCLFGASSSVMNSQYSHKNFCVKDDHSEKTAQHRVYRSSSWETLVRDPKNDPKHETKTANWPRMEIEGLAAPDGDPTTQSGGLDHLEVIWMEDSNPQVVLVFDESGSMYGEKLNQAKNAGKAFADLLSIGDRVAVVAYSSSVRTALGLTEISSPPPQSVVKNAVDSLSARGMTAMGDALREALNLLSQPGDIDSRRSVVLLSNGWHNWGSEHPLDVLPSYQDNGIPIYTIGLGAYAQEQLLKQLSSGSGGTYNYAPSPNDLQDIYAGVSQESGTDSQMLSQNTMIMEPGEVAYQSVSVDSGLKHVTFVLSWPPGDHLDFVLITPSGDEINASNWNQYPMVSFSTEQTYALYRVESPAAGSWMGEISATSPGSPVQANFLTRSQGGIRLFVTLGESTVKSPTPLDIVAVLSRRVAITGAKMTAIFTGPDGAPFEMPLRDDGIPPDTIPEDGKYAGTFADYWINGLYGISVTASNPDNLAVETGAGLLEQGDRETGFVIGENFQRTWSGLFEVTHISTDDHGNSPYEATPVSRENDGTWGRIEQAGDSDFFSFDLEADKHYTIQVSSLLDGMDPLLQIFAADGVTVAGVNDNVRGGLAASLLFKPVEAGTYFASVSHTDGAGTGTYLFSVGPAQIWDTDAKVHIDLKPGSCPNPFNSKSGGILPSAILGSVDFDVTTIAPDTIKLTVEGTGRELSPIRWSFEDVASPYEGFDACGCSDIDGDGYLDLTLKFDSKELSNIFEIKRFAGETIPLMIHANLLMEHGGFGLSGEDCVLVLK